MSRPGHNRVISQELSAALWAVVYGARDVIGEVYAPEVNMGNLRSALGMLDDVLAEEEREME